ARISRTTCDRRHPARRIAAFDAPIDAPIAAPTDAPIAAPMRRLTCAPLCAFDATRCPRCA
ncbi:MAG TPA: hypothetical protein VFN46_03710, partial [Acetobacteraceae bacterium]|nr:hypothetical protein [Acetobacteraceae bacterium]